MRNRYIKIAKASDIMFPDYRDKHCS